VRKFCTGPTIGTLELEPDGPRQGEYRSAVRQQAIAKRPGCGEVCGEVLHQKGPISAVLGGRRSSAPTRQKTSICSLFGLPS
jgi:hypothetical protein